jgi:hypothetical protein
MIIFHELYEAFKDSDAPVPKDICRYFHKAILYILWIAFIDRFKGGLLHQQYLSFKEYFWIIEEIVIEISGILKSRTTDLTILSKEDMSESDIAIR